MLEQVAQHGGLSLSVSCKGDLEIDAHHTIEDCALTFGQALKQALGERRGIARYGFVLPMDEAEAKVSIDLGGRSYLVFEGAFAQPNLGDYPTEMTEHVFRSLAQSMGAAIHVSVKGENDHHKTEACFKAFGRALRQAIARTQDNAPIWDFQVMQILSEGRDAIEIYRDANREERTTNPPSSFSKDAFEDVEPPSSAEILESLQTAFARATNNITACKSQLAGARAQLEAEYHSFYDDELTPFLKNIENNATVNVRSEFDDGPPAKRAAVRVEETVSDEPPEEPSRGPLSFKRLRGQR